MDILNAYAFLMILLLIKHYIADIALQTNWMALNKGTFGHLGGIIHAGIHAVFTFVVLMAKGLDISPHNATTWLYLPLAISLAEWVVHYIIDWSKMNIDAHFKWSRLLHDDKDKITGRLIISTRYYWSLVGDQCLHFGTYIGIGWLFLAITLA